MYIKIYSLCVAVCFFAGAGHAKDKRADLHKDHVAGTRISTELRAARWMLDNWPGEWLQAKDVIAAEKEIDDAIGEMDKAAIGDGESATYHLPVDNRVDTIGRMREAIEFLSAAHDHLTYDQPGRFTKELRSATLKHIAGATAALNKAIAAAEKAAKQQLKSVPGVQTASNYPTYSHALYNLRAARWMLEHMPSNWPQAQEERDAIKQVEAAIYEIKNAGIDDGKAIEIDTPMGEEPGHINHLKAANSFLKKAREDVAHGEEDVNTRLLRGPLFANIDEATRKVIIAEHMFTWGDEPLLAPVHRICPLPTGLDGVIYLYH